MHRFCLLLALVSIAAGCPADPRPGGSSSYSRSLGDDPDFSEPHARIQAKTWFAFGETSLQGYFADGPDLRVHEETERIGSCRLMEYTPSMCTPDCGTDGVCVGGECVAWPERVDRGELDWSWPDGEQTVEPDDILGYWGTGAAESAGDVSITGEDISLTSPTIDSAEPVGAWDQLLEDRAGDVTLRWSNPIQDARVRLFMTDCTGSHGGFADAEIECEGPDTGELVIPGTFLDLLEAGDWSRGECGSHTFDRYHSAAPDGDTTVRFETIGPGGFFYFPTR
jgi:hypothetical protein